MHLTVEFDREEDGRWIADVIDLPGAMAYGRTQMEALAAVKALTLRILADKLEQGELPTPRTAHTATRWLRREISFHRHLPVGEINRQGLASEEVETKKAINTCARR